MRRAFAIFSVMLPWRLRRVLLSWLLGYELHPTSRIGLSLVFPAHLVMGPGTRISHLNVCKGMDTIEMGENSTIGRLNWITGYPTPSRTGDHYEGQDDRRSELILEPNSGITNRHLIDCTNSIRLGKFSNIGGFRSQLMTHSVVLESGRQSSAPITIGAYSLVGTACVMLGGSSLAEYSVLSACSLANKPMTETYTLYGGIPARVIKPLSRDGGYFTRQTGFVL